MPLLVGNCWRHSGDTLVIVYCCSNWRSLEMFAIGGSMMAGGTFERGL